MSAHKGGVRMVLTVDSREASKNPKIVEFLKQHDVPVEISLLPAGDYLVHDALLIERKTAIDFIHSLTSGRLWEELGKLSIAKESNENLKTCVAVEGSLALIKKFSKINIESVVGALFSIYDSWRVQIFFFPSVLWFSSFLVTVHKKTASPAGERRPRLVFSKPGKSKEEIQLAILCTVPEIGVVHAKRILSSFGSIKNVANASVDELLKVEGIGRKRAEAIQEAFS
jgi:ERCC4-type nuclease